MTAIIAILDEQGIHIGTDGRSCCNRRKTDDFVKCKTLGDTIIYTCAGDSDIIEIVDRFYNIKGSYNIEDETLFELKEFIEKYSKNEYGVILSDGNIIKLIEKESLRHEYGHIRIGTGGLQALSAYNALNINTTSKDKKQLITQSIKVAIDMDENCGGEPKYYFLKKNV